LQNTPNQGNNHTKQFQLFCTKKAHKDVIPVDAALLRPTLSLYPTTPEFQPNKHT
jgi:hypothetical protein